MKRTLSVIIPAYNEEGNIIPLYEELREYLRDLIKNENISDYEIIFIDDGSTDGTWRNLEKILKSDSKLRAIRFRRNFGQTASLNAGFDICKGDLIVTMDGDMQNDPADIKNLIKKLDEGFDIVSGWRFNRKDKFTKKIFSKIMNFIRKKTIGDELHDYGCSLKIYKKECIKDLQLTGELHRYVTAYLYIKGYKIGEIKVNHRARKSGKTKYRFNRGINGLLDLFFLKFWADFSDKPLHFFGRLGIYQWILAFVIVIEQIAKAIIIRRLIFGPLLALASMLVITGLLFIIFGFLSEIMSRIYFKEKKKYSIKENL